MAVRTRQKVLVIGRNLNAFENGKSAAGGAAHPPSRAHKAACESPGAPQQRNYRRSVTDDDLE
jgi:hypothetical protein